MIPGAPGEPGLLAVGVPGGDLGGTPGSGGVVVYRYDAARGWSDLPAMVVVGDSRAPGSQLGAGLFGSDDAGGLLLVGAPTSGEIGPEQGAVYAVSLEE